MLSPFLFDDIREHIDRGDLLGAVYIDLTKAFDTFGHGLLIQKLIEYGIEAIELEWFTSYLFNRSQVASIDNALSNKMPLWSGVPQGSILGPLLFIIFFNNFSESLINTKTASILTMLSYTLTVKKTP